MGLPTLMLKVDEHMDVWPVNKHYWTNIGEFAKLQDVRMICAWMKQIQYMEINEGRSMKGSLMEEGWKIGDQQKEGFDGWPFDDDFVNTMLFRSSIEDF